MSSSQLPDQNISRRRLWGIFICAILGSFFIHEIGHCAVAWFHGYSAVPTPMKEYVFGSVPQQVQNQVALGGIIGSVAALLAVAFWLNAKAGPIGSALFAGAMTAPGFYTLRFILAGRGHDGAEFQEAQAALGLTYSGHAIDWLFVVLFAAASAFWLWRTRPALTFRLVGRLLAGSAVALLVLVLVQSVNNAVFDRLFAAGSTP